MHTGDVFCTAPLILLKMFFCEPRSDITERDDRRSKKKKGIFKKRNKYLHISTEQVKEAALLLTF